MQKYERFARWPKKDTHIFVSFRLSPVNQRGENGVTHKNYANGCGRRYTGIPVYWYTALQSASSKVGFSKGGGKVGFSKGGGRGRINNLYNYIYYNIIYIKYLDYKKSKLSGCRFTQKNIRYTSIPVYRYTGYIIIIRIGSGIGPSML